MYQLLCCLVLSYSLPCFSFLYVCSPALIVPKTPGDEAALLPYSIMNEGSFQPAHSSLLQQETLSCQPHSLHAPPSWPCLHICLYPTWTVSKRQRRRTRLHHHHVHCVGECPCFSGEEWWRNTRTVQSSPLLYALYWLAGTLQSNFFFVHPCSRAHTTTHMCTPTNTHRNHILERRSRLLGSVEICPRLWCG